MHTQTIYRVGAQQQGAGPVLSSEDDHEWDEPGAEWPTGYKDHHGVSITGQDTAQTKSGPAEAEPDQVSQVKRSTPQQGRRVRMAQTQARQQKAEVRPGGLVSWQPTRSAVRSERATSVQSQLSSCVLPGTGGNADDTWRDRQFRARSHPLRPCPGAKRSRRDMGHNKDPRSTSTLGVSA